MFLILNGAVVKTAFLFGKKEINEIKSWAKSICIALGVAFVVRKRGIVKPLLSFYCR